MPDLIQVGLHQKHIRWSFHWQEKAPWAGNSNDFFKGLHGGPGAGLQLDQHLAALGGVLLRDQVQLQRPAGDAPLQAQQVHPQVVRVPVAEARAQALAQVLGNSTRLHEQRPAAQPGKEAAFHIRLRPLRRAHAEVHLCFDAMVKQL
eukprot:CAMPEP_0194566984 /NCGR_PEP_ID=MMETSP0292-20121207/5634_1 /TAXON_ID=39354 /ORGANISM="Heterosigma akashiwo, Strain CCMP2393" /LENGTH=146 /DNA_ID=CAMNT_0039416649 /DNA_START=402 /DNA_END=842 /DNA_ORIENTATION=-